MHVCVGPAGDGLVHTKWGGWPRVAVSPATSIRNLTHTSISIVGATLPPFDIVTADNRSSCVHIKDKIISCLLSEQGNAISGAAI
jgi:hypothetical protein